MADWTRYLLVSGGDATEIRRAAQHLSRAGFEVTVMEGVTFTPGQTITDVESVAPISPVPRALGGGDDELIAGPVRIDVPGRQVRVGAELIDLTTSEFDLCAFLVRNRGRVISKRELVNHLRGSDHYSANLVEVIVSAVRRKLGPDAAAIIETVRGVGYVVRNDSSSDN